MTRPTSEPEAVASLGNIQPGSLTHRVLTCVQESGDSGCMSRDVSRQAGVTGDQARRILCKLFAAGKLHRAPEPRSLGCRYFGTAAAAAKWRRLYPTGLSDAEARSAGIRLGKRNGTLRAKAAGMAAPVTLPADVQRVVKSGDAIWTGKERVTVAQHKPDPRYYVDPKTVPRVFSAMKPGQYLQETRA